MIKAIIISGPSGVGKTTITKQVKESLGAVLSVSFTTREKTVQDTEGVDYHFVTKNEFNEIKKNNGFIEWAKVFDNYYGTPKYATEKCLNENKLIIFELDIQGAINIKSVIKDSFAIFVMPPDEKTLLERLRTRDRESEEDIQKRFANAKKEMKFATESRVYDLFLTNKDLKDTVKEALKIINIHLY